ncbi:MAG: amidohydrolase [Magnetococcales bacterium]|nr:amidohydrolase [Magnetococcales bacterium]
MSLMFAVPQSQAEPKNPIINDSHFHLTNYVQKGPTPREFLKTMGDKVGKSALMGLPLQQKWDFFVSGNRVPDYYLESDARLYYYSFVDAALAKQYLALTPEEQNRFDPMITGFNPTDMYATDHIERVLRTFPGVFTGIGEFSIHKEFVSSKIAGHTASVNNRAFHEILKQASEIGLLVVLHCDINTIRNDDKLNPAHYLDVVNVLRKHPKANIIWAHTGLGRYVKPTTNHTELLLNILNDPALSHVYFDLAWDEIAKYIQATPETTRKWAAVINAHPERFLAGTDSVAPRTQEKYFKNYTVHQPLIDLLSNKASRMVRLENYDTLFGDARRKVRDWETRHVAR